MPASAPAGGTGAGDGAPPNRRTRPSTRSGLWRSRADSARARRSRAGQARTRRPAVRPGTCHAGRACRRRAGREGCLDRWETGRRGALHRPVRSSVRGSRRGHPEGVADRWRRARRRRPPIRTAHLRHRVLGASRRRDRGRGDPVPGLDPTPRACRELRLDPGAAPALRARRNRLVGVDRAGDPIRPEPGRPCALGSVPECGARGCARRALPLSAVGLPSEGSRCPCRPDRAGPRGGSRSVRRGLAGRPAGPTGWRTPTPQGAPGAGPDRLNRASPDRAGVRAPVPLRNREAALREW